MEVFRVVVPRKIYSNKVKPRKHQKKKVVTHRFHLCPSMHGLKSRKSGGLEISKTFNLTLEREKNE